MEIFTCLHIICPDSKVDLQQMPLQVRWTSWISPLSLATQGDLLLWMFLACHQWDCLQRHNKPIKPPEVIFCWAIHGAMVWSKEQWFHCWPFFYVGYDMYICLCQALHIGDVKVWPVWPVFLMSQGDGQKRTIGWELGTGWLTRSWWDRMKGGATCATSWGFGAGFMGIGFKAVYKRYARVVVHDQLEPFETQYLSMEPNFTYIHFFPQNQSHMVFMWI